MGLRSRSQRQPDEATIDGNVAQLTRRYKRDDDRHHERGAGARARDRDARGVGISLVVTAQRPHHRLRCLRRSVVWTATTSGKAPTESSPAIDLELLFVYAGIDGKAHKYRIGDGVEVTGDGWPQIATLKTMSRRAPRHWRSRSPAAPRTCTAVNDGYIGDAGDYQVTSPDRPHDECADRVQHAAATSRCT